MRVHPDASRACVGCGALERLYHHGLCDSCALRRKVTGLLTNAEGEVRPDLAPIVECVCGNPPARMLKWLRSPTPQNLLRAIAAAPAPITHSVLDDPTGPIPSEAVSHLRTPLVVAPI